MPRHLLISRSWAYRCVQRASELARCQRHLSGALVDTSLPRPWRRFKLCRVPVQLTLDSGTTRRCRCDLSLAFGMHDDIY